jgi:hypothetical protein
LRAAAPARLFALSFFVEVAFFLSGIVVLGFELQIGSEE